MSAFGLFKVTLAACSDTAKFVLMQLRGQGDEGDDAKAEPVDDAPFLQQLGVAARPVITRSLRSLGIRYGDEVWNIKVWDKTKTPTGLAEGETRVFSSGKITVSISLTSDGHIKVTADGGDILLNVKPGEGSRVAREKDDLNVGTLMGQAGPYPVIFTYVPGAAVGVGPTQGGPSVNLAGVIKAGTGAEHVKA